MGGVKSNTGADAGDDQTKEEGQSIQAQSKLQAERRRPGIAFDPENALPDRNQLECLPESDSGRRERSPPAKREGTVGLEQPEKGCRDKQNSQAKGKHGVLSRLTRVLRQRRTVRRTGELRKNRTPQRSVKESTLEHKKIFF